MEIDIQNQQDENERIFNDYLARETITNVK
jgi:hypothetical protein